MKIATLYIAMADGRESHDDIDYGILLATFDKAKAEQAVRDYIIKYNVGPKNDLKEWRSEAAFNKWLKGRDIEWAIRNMNDFSCIIPDIVTKQVELP